MEIKKSMKNLWYILTAFIAAVIAVAALTVSASSEEITSGDYSYEVLEDGTAEITDYTGLATELTIPSEINGYTVTSIGDMAFYDCRYLKSVTISDSVTSIGKYAFYLSENLVYITIFDSVKSIGRGAFMGTSYYKDESNWENELLYIDNWLIAAKSDITSADIKAGTIRIADAAFSSCFNLTSITIPNSVISIGWRIFENCNSLKSITIPDNVTSIQEGAFGYCIGLTSIVVSKNNSAYKSESGVLLTIDSKKLICYPAGKTDTEYVIPDGVTSINEAFAGCESLTGITIPQSVTSIDGAFAGCENLTNITIPDSVTSIGHYAFDYCTSLTSITIPDNVTSIEEWAFGYCKSLTSIIISDSVESIGESAFEGCNSLTNITIPDNVTTIGKYAFAFCKSLTSIIIPDSVTSIGNCAFEGCRSLTSITIPDSVTSIGNSAFVLCTSLISITIPDGVTSIGNGTFDSCASLTSITIPNSVTSIGDYAFEYCDNLASITIPKSVTNIGYGAFSGCDGLTDVYFEGTEEEWNKITIEANNQDLLNATIHFNYVSPEMKISAFVNRLYTIILGRDAEPEGLADWTNRLVSGTASSAEIVYGIANSQEFANRGLSNDEIVETMYQAMLGRASDEGGKADWLNCLNSGMTVTGIINGFSGSQEFANICAEYGIQAGAITNCEARDRNKGLTLFVSRMYTKALNRPYDIAGLNDWTNRYLTGEAKVSDIAFGFIFSPEFVGKGLSDSDYVDTLYRTFFNREPDEGGKADWMNKLANGMAREDVLNGFVGSQECINLVATFGI